MVHWAHEEFNCLCYQKAILHELYVHMGTVICYMVLCIGQLSGEKGWLQQMKSLELFNPVTAGTLQVLSKIHSDTVLYVFSCAGENQKSVEDSELLFSSCTQSERTSFHHWLFVLGFGFIVIVPQGKKISVSANVGINVWKELVLK